MKRQEGECGREWRRERRRPAKCARHGNDGEDDGPDKWDPEVRERREAGRDADGWGPPRREKRGRDAGGEGSADKRAPQGRERGRNRAAEKSGWAEWEAGSPRGFLDLFF